MSGSSGAGEAIDSIATLFLIFRRKEIMAVPQSQPNPPTSFPGSHCRGKFNFWQWFRVSTIPVSLGWLWYDFYAPGNHIAWAKAYGSAQHQADESGKPMIIFSGKRYSPCRIMKRNVWADAEVEAAVNARFTPVMIDVDDPHEASVLSRYRVGATPTTIITDAHGGVLTRVQGVVGKTEFLELMAREKRSAAMPLP